MNKEIVNILQNLAPGTLLWIYSDNKKVYYSSRRFDIVEFMEHESNYLGELEDIYQAIEKQNPSLLELLKKTDRVYGICLESQSDQIVEKKQSMEEDGIKFFASWEKLQDFTTPYFETFDNMEKKRSIEKKRRKEARDKWLQRGRRFIHE